MNGIAVERAYEKYHCKLEFLSYTGNNPKVQLGKKRLQDQGFLGQSDPTKMEPECVRER